MYRLVLVAAVAMTGCSQSDNDRPATLEYITEAILQPSCSQATCHSSYRRENDYAFDTVEASRKSIAGRLVIVGDADASLLYTVLVRTEKRMPYDAPMADKDIELIQTWIATGAEGLVVAP